MAKESIFKSDYAFLSIVAIVAIVFMAGGRATSPAGVSYVGVADTGSGDLAGDARFKK